MRRCRADPLFFSKYVLGGDQPWGRQSEILRAVRDARRVAVRSGHGVGKTWTAARAAVWYLYSHPHSIVLTTAPTHRQVRSILWAEIRKQVRAARVPLGGRMTETRLALDDDWFALGLSTDEPERFQGYHAEHLMLVMDEAPGISPEIYDAARGLLTSRHARVLLIGNPTAPSGPFYEAFRQPGWRTIHIACTDCPNVTRRRVIYPRLVTAEWVEAQRAEWGAESPAFRTRVLGEFPQDADSQLVPLAWIHAAQARVPGEVESASELRMGVDVARYGSDRTVLLVADCAAVREVHAAVGLSTMETAGRIIAQARATGIRPERIAVDDTGLGGGVTDRLREQGWRVHAVNGAASPRNPNFENRRAELFWAVREAISPDNAQALALPPKFARLASELSHLRYELTSRGRIRLGSKDTVRAALGRSPDRADAFALSFAPLSARMSPPRIWAL